MDKPNIPDRIEISSIVVLNWIMQTKQLRDIMQERNLLADHELDSMNDLIEDMEAEVKQDSILSA